ncbi:MAG TPA: RNA-binding protein [bacterium]|nr:RNA-binding protein [bacterium]
MNIYVGNLPKTTTEEAVRKVFEEYGEVTEVKLIKDNYSGELRGFGFIEMSAKADAQKAIEEVDGTELEGNTLIVNEARPRRNRSGGGQRGGGQRGPRSRSW